MLECKLSYYLHFLFSVSSFIDLFLCFCVSSARMYIIFTLLYRQIHIASVIVFLHDPIWYVKLFYLITTKQQCCRVYQSTVCAVFQFRACAFAFASLFFLLFTINELKPECVYLTRNLGNILRRKSTHMRRWGYY